MYLMNYTNLLQCWTLYSYSMQVDLNKNTTRTWAGTVETNGRMGRLRWNQ